MSFAAMTTAMLSGILISKSALATLGISLSAGPAWRSIHSLPANVSLVFVAIHFALHWNRVVTNVRRFITAPMMALVQRPTVRPNAQLTAS